MSLVFFNDFRELHHPKRVLKSGFIMVYISQPHISVDVYNVTIFGGGGVLVARPYYGIS